MYPLVLASEHVQLISDGIWSLYLFDVVFIAYNKSARASRELLPSLLRLRSVLLAFVPLARLLESPPLSHPPPEAKQYLETDCLWVEETHCTPQMVAAWKTSCLFYLYRN